MQKWTESQGQKLSRREMLEQWKRTREKQETPRKSLSMIPKAPKFEEVLRNYEPKVKREGSVSSKSSVAKDFVPSSPANLKRNSQMNTTTSMIVKSKMDIKKEKQMTTPISKSQSCKKFPVQQSPRAKPTQSVCKENVLKKITIPKELYSQKPLTTNRKPEKKMSIELMRKASLKGISPMKDIIDNISSVQHEEMEKEQLMPLNNEQAQITERVLRKSASEEYQSMISDGKEETRSNHTNETQCEQASPKILAVQLLDEPSLCENKIENSFAVQPVDLQPQEMQDKIVHNIPSMAIEHILPVLAKAGEGQSEEQFLPKENEAQEKQINQSEITLSQTKKKGSKKRKSKEIEDVKEGDGLEDLRGAFKKPLLEQKLDESTSQKLEEKVKIEFESTMRKSSVKKRAIVAIESQELEVDKYGLEMTLQEIEIKKGKNCVEKMLTSVRRSKRLNSVAKLTSKTWLQ